MKAVAMTMALHGQERAAQEAITAAAEYWRWWFGMFGVKTSWEGWLQ
jgi:hypothetical protein